MLKSSWIASCVSLSLLCNASAWISPYPWSKTMTTTTTRPATIMARHMSPPRREDSSNAEQFLTAADLKKLADMRSRHATMPIMILDAMLPGQCLQFGSADPKFQTLVRHVLQHEQEIGMIGLNPHTGRPLNMGVTLPVSQDRVHVDDLKGLWSISVQGQRRFEVQGEPWLDDTKSFYMAEVEIVDHREEPLSNQQQNQAQILSDQIPTLVEQWMKWVLNSGKTDVPGMTRRMQDIGPMPEEIGARAIWVAALVNPLPALGVCLEVRPAMLACKNDLDRINLASAAIQSSIDHLSGKRRLF